jgi:hypothetical protein
MVGMCGEVPDHPAATRTIAEAVAVALQVEEPDDLTVFVGDEFDGRLLIVFPLAFNDVEER